MLVNGTLPQLVVSFDCAASRAACRARSLTKAKKGWMRWIVLRPNCTPAGQGSGDVWGCGVRFALPFPDMPRPFPRQGELPPTLRRGTAAAL